MKINTKLKDGKWIEFNEKVSIKLRAFPMDNVMLLSDDFKNTSKAGQGICNYCVCDWKGFEDEDDNEFVYNDENKAYLLNYYTEFYEFITKEVEKLKNLKPHVVKETLKK